MVGKYNEKELLIMQFNERFNDWEDITAQIQWFQEEQNACKVKYFGNEIFYYKSWRKLSIYTKPQMIDVSNKIIFHKGKNLTDILQVLDFGSWCKVFYKNGETSTYRKENLHYVIDRKNDQSFKYLLDYLKEVSKLLSVEDGIDFLYNQLSELTIPDNSVLSKFIDGKLKSSNDNRAVIFPFSTNLSQKKAVKNALENELSIIQGPPGSGKTQTILNIVANYVARGQNVAILSGNNEATKNVEEKLSKEGYSYINAVLGNSKNITAFFELENVFQDTNEKKADLNQLELSIKALETEINRALKYDVDAAKLTQLIGEYFVEKEINDAEYHVKGHTLPYNIQKKQYTSQKYLELASLLEVLPEHKMTGFFNRARLLFRFGIIRVSTIADNKIDVVDYLKNHYYDVKIKELDKEKNEKIAYLKENNAQELFEKQLKLSKLIFEQALVNRYSERKFITFTKVNYRDLFQQFLIRYPVVYSTTHAIRFCTAQSFLYDCVIIDESSQVDLISAIIAFSCAQKVVLVGDQKQISHVIKPNLLEQLNTLFSASNLPICYDYSKNNILQCILTKYPDVPKVLLNEHYRCDPQIISFCNKRFYNNELVIKTVHQVGNGVTIIKHGSHFARGRENERQVDIIDQEISKDIQFKDVGIIAPYRDQVNLLSSRLSNYNYAIDTVHKFQGREKDVIIMSTVANKVQFYADDDKIDFLNNQNLINVAISRAKKRLYILASDEVLNQEGSILRDLSKYCEYYCDETKILNTQVYSVFDLMYDDYSPILEETQKKLLKISDWQSENIISTVIKEVCDEGKYGALSYKFNYPLKYVIKTNMLINDEDIKFASNIHTHCDFVIYSNLNKAIELVIEVDGSQHREEIQANRDLRKDRLLKEAGIKVLRLSTTTIECKNKIINALINKQQY